MVEPRDPKEVQRIIRRANYPTAEADLEEFDRLLSEEAAIDPSARVSDAQNREKSARDRRLEVLSRRLFKRSR